MTEEEKNKIALQRYNMIAPLIIDPEQYPSNKEFFRMQGHKLREDGVTTVCARTIERWYYKFKKRGFDALKPQTRIDSGKTRKDGDVIEQIIVLKRNYPRLSATGIYKMLRESGIKDNQISLSTVNRVINSLSCDKNPSEPMYRYELEHINEVWCGDTSHGPYLYRDKAKIKLFIIALIDDASRLIVGARIFEADNTINLVSTMKLAISKYGKPKRFNFDNGSNYKNSQINIIAARLGVGLHYCRPYNPEAKAKIERWFKTLKSQWMASLRYGEFKSLEEYQTSLNEYVNSYNNTPHSSLNGLTPMERYLQEIELVKKINDTSLQQDFLFEIERKVSVDNIVVIENKEYEVPAVYSSRKVRIRYLDPKDGIFVIDGDKQIQIKPLDKKANAKRVRISLAGDENNE